MKRFLLTVSMWSMLLVCVGQGRTNYWPLGYASYTPDTLGGGMTMEFLIGNRTISDHPRKMWFDYTNAAICTDQGVLQFYSNGIWIANNIEDTMLNGNDLNPSWYTNQWSFWGMQIPQAEIIIPEPGDTNKYYLFHETIDIPVIYYPNKLYVTTIDMQGDSGKGEVIDKNKIILNDTLIAGSLTACKHANGRDWWLIVPEYGTELGFYTFLITPDTIQQVNYQKANAGGIGRMQSCFSPDGKHYIISNWWGIAFYDFDRCSGTLSFNDSISPLDSVNYFGASVSPNSRFCYTAGNNGYDFYQYDLQASDISASQVLVAQWDTFAWPNPPWWTAFYMQQIAPDGKIYIQCPGTTMAMHIIDNPDSAGIGCDVQQHAILLPHFNATIPNFPNYNLGRLVGSPCDTLQWAGIAEQQHDFKFRLYPNPVTSNSLHIGYQLPQNKSGTFTIYDIMGKVVFKYNLPQWSTQQHFTLPWLSDGVYSCVIISNRYRVGKKLAVIKE